MRKIAIVLLAALALAACGVAEPGGASAPTAQPATVTPAGSPIPTPTPIIEPPKSPGQLWPSLIPLLLYAAWFLWRWWRRKLVLERLQTSGTPRLQPLKLKNESNGRKSGNRKIWKRTKDPLL